MMCLVISTTARTAEHVHATIKGIDLLLLGLLLLDGGSILITSSGRASSGSSATSRNVGHEVLDIAVLARTSPQGRPVGGDFDVGGLEKGADVGSADLGITVVESQSCEGTSELLLW